MFGFKRKKMKTLEMTETTTQDTHKITLPLKEDIIEALRNVYDPEIPVNIYELGLIYEVNVNNDLDIEIIMSLTSPFCPAAQSMPAEIKEKLLTIEGVNNVEVKITFDPPWSQDLMSESAKLQLGFM